MERRCGVKVNTQLPAKKAGSVQNALSLNIFVCSSECRPTDSAQPQLGSLEYAKTTNLSSYPTEDYRLNKHQTLYGKFMGTIFDQVITILDRYHFRFRWLLNRDRRSGCPQHPSSGRNPFGVSLVMFTPFRCTHTCR